ncbi:MAG: ABC transporter permease, partial [Gammaproteobacteria bacterium]|nr:ABC transporter permease [Gammaproteobacteria bacterium]NIT64952.1 ABC transporter permease [Gammaproteobacteria bacterium]NIV20599.1 ABC transporter permease [Gammaproteobacteria bacterium]NIY33531.1 ABC transporter permease [Gammaproteobacteria bacterium]
IGSVAGWRRGSLFEKGTIFVLLFLRSAPSFFVGILVLMVFAYTLRWLPSGGMVSLTNDADTFWGMVLSL